MNSLIEKISKISGKSVEEIEKEIAEIIESSSFLIDEDVATKIIAKRYGIKFDYSGKERLLIENLVNGLKNIEIAGVVHKIVKREYEKNGVKKEFLSLIIRDESSFVRVNIWNPENLKMEIKEFEKIKVKGYCKYNKFKKELEINTNSSIEPFLDKIGREAFYYKRLSEMKKSLNLVKATVIEIYGKEKILIDDGTIGLIAKLQRDYKVDNFEEYIFEISFDNKTSEFIIKNVECVEVNKEIEKLLKVFS